MRPVKLDFHDHPFAYTSCKANIVYTSMQAVIVSSQRKGPWCKGELLIEQGVARAISDKKPPKREALAIEKARGNRIRVVGAVWRHL